MNTPTTFTQSLSSFHHPSLLLGLLFLLLSAIGQAADLTFTPTAPIVEQGKQITLSVSGTSGEVTWTVAKGQIQGTGAQVTYVAPAQVGLDVVTVLDNEGNFASVKIVITPPNNFSLENAQWEVFTNRSNRSTLLLSEDGKTLWVGTNGGLEKWNAQTGEIQQVFTSANGLPDNQVLSLLSDSQGGLWVGTYDGGLAHYAQGQWQVFNTDNSDLPNNHIFSLLRDSQGGLWIDAWEGLVYLNAQGQWQVFDTDNSDLPSNYINDFLLDSHDGLWVGTIEGLAHYAQGRWQVFNTENSDLPSNEISVLFLDHQEELWVGTHCESKDYFDEDEDEEEDYECIGGGLAHLNVQGQWQVFNMENSGLPDNWVDALLLDSQGGLWVGTKGGGLAHYAQGQWQVFNTYNSGLPDSRVWSLHLDSQGGLWVGTDKGLAYYAQGQWQMFNTDNSTLSDNRVYSIFNDGQGGLWAKTENGLARYTQGQWQVFKTNHSGLLPDNIITALTGDDQGGLWIGTSHGLAHYTQSQWTVMPHFPVFDTWVRTILSDGQGGVWVGTSEKLAHYAQGQWQVSNFLPSNALLSDGRGGLWIGTGGGLINRAQEGGYTTYTMEKSGLPGNGIRVLLSDGQGGLWIGVSCNPTWLDTCDGGGLAHYNNQGQWQMFNKENSGLPESNINALALDNQGGLWVGLGGTRPLHLERGMAS